MIKIPQIEPSFDEKEAKAMERKMLKNQKTRVHKIERGGGFFF